MISICSDNVLVLAFSLSFFFCNVCHHTAVYNLVESLKRRVHVFGFGVRQCNNSPGGETEDEYLSVKEDVRETWKGGVLPRRHSDLLYCNIF